MVSDLPTKPPLSPLYYDIYVKVVSLGIVTTYLPLSFFDSCDPFLKNNLSNTISEKNDYQFVFFDAQT